jgi:hypothetical protein
MYTNNPTPLGVRNLKSLLLCLLLISAFTASAYAAGYYQKHVEVNWVVVKGEGIEVSSNIVLGEIPQGSSKTTSLWVKNAASEPLRVSITLPLTLNGITITVSPQSFVLNPGQNRTVTVTVSVADFVSTGPYSTTLLITARSA